MRTRKHLVDIILFLFIALFVYAAVTKLMDFEKFETQLSQSPMLTDHAEIIAWFIPALELLIVLVLMFERKRLLGFFAAFGMMVMFTAYIVVASRFSEYVPCSCGGVIENLTWEEHLVFNGFFILIGIIAITVYPRSEGLAKNKFAE